MERNERDEATWPALVELERASDHASSLPAQSIVLEGQALKSVIGSYFRYYAAGDTHTARAKRYDLGYFLEFLAGSPERIDLVRVSDWTVERTQAFVDDRLQRGEAPATVSRRLATIKHFGRTLAERVRDFINPAREVRGPVLPTTRPHGLDDDEVRVLRWAADPANYTDNPSFNAYRNQFLVELLLGTGLRADEVRVLTVGQISADQRWLKNVKTKGRKYRNVYLSGTVRACMESYLERRLAALREKTPKALDLSSDILSSMPVLISFYRASPARPSSFGLSPKTIWRVIAETGKRARQNQVDLLGNLHPHRLRHTFAHGLLDSSKDIRLVAQALGHSDVRTTMRYTERSEEEIARAIESAERNS
ncbi:MAG: tyrosine-type recombinase/integrase [Bdellovibrionales bacterium]|nr:tyrosine-type recombinase/integrase [Bdellovibrionales bacterium]